MRASAARNRKAQSLVFLAKFIAYLNVYGNLFLVAAILGVVADVALWSQAAKSVVEFCLIAGVSAATLFFLAQGLLITSSFARKRSFYLLTARWLDRGGFKEKYFLDEMYEPCMRILIRDLLASRGLSGEYRGLVRAWRGGPATLTEKRRQAILHSLENQDQHQ